MTRSDSRPGEPSGRRTYLFGPFRLDVSKRRLYGEEGEPLALTARVFDTLLYLVRNQQRVIEKEELMREIWGDTIVEENNLNKNISILRRILGENKDEHRFIVTIPGRGYQFVAEVREADERNGDGEAGFSPAADAEANRTVDTPPGWVPGKEKYRNWWRLALLAGTVLFLGGLSALALWRERPPVADAPIRTIAVLPFQSLVPGTRDEALELGMADALINRISSSEEIIVRPLSSVRRYDSPERDAIGAGRELGADAVLEGTIQASAGRTRIAARLIRTRDGKQLWTGRFDEPPGHLFDVQDSISEKVLDALMVKLGSAAQRRLKKRHTDDIEAYQLYMKGRFYQSRLILPQATRSAELYRQAIALDPNYALAYVGLADAYRSFALSGDVDSRIALEQAAAAASRAMELDPFLPESQVASGMDAFWHRWDWNAAEESYRRAIELDPNHPHAHFLAAHLYSTLGRADQAVAMGRRARELDPLSLIANSAEGQFLFFAGRPEEALATLDRAFELDPDFWHAHLVRSLVFAQQAKYPEAIAAADRASEISGGNSQALAARGYALARSADLAGAREVLVELQEKARMRHVPPYSLAIVHNAIGESEEALELLERGFAQRDPLMVFLKIDRRWDILRNHPRFRRLMAQMRLE